MRQLKDLGLIIAYELHGFRLNIKVASCKTASFFRESAYPLHLFSYRLATVTVNMRVLTY